MTHLTCLAAPSSGYGHKEGSHAFALSSGLVTAAEPLPTPETYPFPRALPCNIHVTYTSIRYTSVSSFDTGRTVQMYFLLRTTEVIVTMTKYSYIIPIKVQSLCIINPVSSR